jgi:hypothetical protein
MDILTQAHTTFLIELLNSGVEFMLIGGYAVNFHGYARYTADMDIWLKPNEMNKEKFISFIKIKGFSESAISHIKSLDFSKANAFHIGSDEEKIDFLTLIGGVKYEEAEKQCLFLEISNNRIPVIHYHHLIRNKELSARPKDLADVNELREINKFRKPPQ